MPFNSDNTYRDPRQRLQSSAYAPTNQGGPGNPGTANNMPQNQQRPDPFQQYGYSGQSPSLGRYVPPMMGDRNNPQSWGNQGGYAYNIPNSYGNPQYNQFNSGGMSNPQFGQSQNVPPPMPQLAPAQRELMTMFSGLPGMSSITDPYREQLRPPVPQANYGMQQQQPVVGMQYGNGPAKPVGLGTDTTMSRPPVPGMSYPMGPDGKALRTSDQDGYGGQEENENGMGGSPDKNRFTEWFSDKFPRATQFVRNEMNDPNPMFDMRNMIPGMGALGGLFNRPRGGGAPPSGGGSGGPMQSYAGPRADGSDQPPIPMGYQGPRANGNDREGLIQNIRPQQGGVRPPMPSSNRGRSSASLNAMRGEMSDDRIRNAVADMRAHEWRGRS